MEASIIIWLLSYAIIIIAFSLVAIICSLLLGIISLHAFKHKYLSSVVRNSRWRILILILMSSFACVLMHGLRMYRDFWNWEDYYVNYGVYVMHMISEMSFYCALVVLLFLMMDLSHFEWWDRFMPTWSQRWSHCISLSSKLSFFLIINLIPAILTLFYFCFGVDPHILYFTFISYFFLLVATNAIVFLIYGYLLYRRMKRFLVSKHLRRFVILLGCCLLTHWGQSILSLAAMPSVLIKPVEHQMNFINAILYLLHYGLELIIICILLTFGRLMRGGTKKKAAKQPDGTKRRWSLDGLWSRVHNQGYGSTVDTSFDTQEDGDDSFVVDEDWEAQ